MSYQGISDDGWYYRVWQGATGRWVAECKREPFVTQHPVPEQALFEEGDIYFEFGETPEAAIEALKASHRDDLRQ